MACVEQEGAAYGCNDALKGQKIMVEFVSANPTGPMHMGNALSLIHIFLCARVAS